MSIAEIKELSDTIIPRSADTQRHLETIECLADWLAKCETKGWNLTDSERVRIRDIYSIISNIGDEVQDAIEYAVSGHDPANGLNTIGWEELL